MRRSLEAYADRLITVDDGQSILSAITVHELPGHSPGHLVYEIASGGRSLVCWGDICHHRGVLASPELGFMFDDDAALAIRSRRRLLASLADRNVDVLAYHFPFPGLGRLRRLASARYSWTPLAEQGDR